MAHHLLSQILRPHPQDRPTLEQILTHPWLHNNPNNLNPSFSTAPARVASEPSFATAAEQKQPEPCSHKQSPATLVAGWGFIEGEEEEDGTGETDGEGGSEGGWEVGGYCDPGLDGGEQEEEEGRALWRWVCGEGAEGEIGAATPSLLASAASALAAYADGGMISVASSESL